MQSDVWYDLVLRELVNGGDLTKDRRDDAESAQPPAPPGSDAEPPTG